MKRTNIILTGIFIILLVIAFFVLRRQGEISDSVESRDFFFKLDSNTIDKFVIKNVFGKFTLEKKGIAWYVKSPIEFPADEKRMIKAVSQCGNLKLIDVISNNPANQTVYKVDTSSTLVTVYAKGMEKARFYVGKASPNFMESFVRRDNSKDVVLVPGALTYTFNVPLRDWRNKTIFLEDISRIKEIYVENKSEKFTVKFADSTWLVDGTPANLNEIKSLLRNLSNYQTDFFEDSVITSLPKLTGTVSVNGKKIEFFQADSEKYYIKSSQSTQLFWALKWKVGQVLKNKKELIAEQ